MSATKHVLELVRDMASYYKQEQGWIYPDDSGTCRLHEEHEEDIAEVINNQEKYYLADGHLKSLGEWHLAYSQYACVHLHDKALQKAHFAQSAWCGYLTTKTRGEFNRFRNPLIISMNTVLLFWSNCILCGWLQEATDIGERCILPPEQGGGLINDGWSFDRSSWFLLELHNIWHRNNELDHTLFANYPDKQQKAFIYNEILQNWDTPDPALVDGYVRQMADYHLTQTQEAQNPVEEYFEFDNTYNQLYPYEIMAWLKLREYLGIPNPSEFSHPLMNQPLGSFIKGTPLERPRMEQVENLLGVVRNALPEANI
jgi:hypothetical protein